MDWLWSCLLAICLLVFDKPAWWPRVISYRPEASNDDASHPLTWKLLAGAETLIWHQGGWWHRTQGAQSLFPLTSLQADTARIPLTKPAPLHGPTTHKH